MTAATRHHSTAYPKTAPSREARIDSPLPIVSEAITAPGPKNFSSDEALGRRPISPSGAGGSVNRGSVDRFWIVVMVPVRFPRSYSLLV